jgi:hypothetical protein
MGEPSRVSRPNSGVRPALTKFRGDLVVRPVGRDFPRLLNIRAATYVAS